MEDIVINGINLNDLKNQINSIRQESSRLISENIQTAQELTKQLVKSENKEEIEVLAKQAYTALSKANFISGVSGVEFNMPYNSSYNGEYDDDTLSAMLEDTENEVLRPLVRENNDLRQLLDLSYSMEYQTQAWNASFC